MDNQAPLGNLHQNLFSRGASPGAQNNGQFPMSSYPDQQPQQQSQQALPPSNAGMSPTLSRKEPSPPAGPNPIDALFHNMNAPSISAQQTGSSAVYPYAAPGASNSAPATPLSTMTAGSGSSNPHSAPSVTAAERHGALLSLLGNVSSPAAAAANPLPPPHPQQIPTPPGSSQRHVAPSTSSESQNKLLEQLMSGTAPRGNYNDSPVGSLHASAPSPPYGVSPYAPLHAPQSESELWHGGEQAYVTQTRELPQIPAPLQQQLQQQAQAQAPQQQAPQPPSPTTRPTIFDYVSPFDALAGPAPAKKKSAPAPAPQAQVPVGNGNGNGEDASWAQPPLVVDPKRKSMDNLMEQLTRGQPPVQPSPAAYEAYLAGEEMTPIAEARAILPPQQPKQSFPEIGSPRSSPPKIFAQAQQRPQPRAADSGVGNSYSGQGARRDKESSPGPRGTAWRDGGKGKGKGKSHTSPNHQPQTIVFDVSQPLDDVQAPRDCVKSTAIALVKVDSTFLPGTTIGATHWVAYAMTKGRVRVISRSSGDRTLLQLPLTFPQTTVVTDMAVYGNRLAGVTSDGGFVVWELPDLITDDVPGRILLCVYPTQDTEALQSVKWHPKQSDTLAIASINNIHLLNIVDADHLFGGEPIPQSELHRVGPVFSIPSPLVAFDFAVHHFALGTITEDSTLTMWSIRDKLPFWSNKIRGEDMPSSLAFIDGGVIVGRRNGTVFQLLPVMSKIVCSTIKFVNGNKDDVDMFGHANYDARIQTLWIANNRRDSMVAFKIGFETAPPSATEDESVRGYFEQAIEFGGPKPTIHFVILTADADPTGSEAHAACVAAKVPPGELALVAFSVHSSGVDQVLIRKEWYDVAASTAPAKFPPYVGLSTAPALAPEPRTPRQPSNTVPAGGNTLPAAAAPAHAPVAPARLRTPPSEEIETELARDEVRTEPKGKNAKGKSVGWKEKERDRDDGSGKEKASTSKGEQPATGENAIGTVLSKEIRKLEDNLHTRIGRLVGKELDKQHQRLEEVRASEQQADFMRQEKILKLISNELTKNTTRVVEMAVKSEVQNSVLPSLENITRTEVKAALNGQIAKGVTESVKQALPTEIERLLLRTNVADQIIRNFSTSVTPVIERHIKDAISKTLIPTYSQQSSAMHQELTREIRSEIQGLKKDITSWQTEALRGQESVIRDLEQSVRALSDQVKFLSMNSSMTAAAPIQQHHGGQARNSPSGPQQPPPGGHAQYNNSHLRQTTLPVNHAPPNYPPPQQIAYQQPAPPANMQQSPMQQSAMQQQGPWYPANIAAPQASHPTLPPPIPAPLPAPQQPVQQQQPVEEYDDTYLQVLQTESQSQLSELLNRSNPDVIMPLKGTAPLSQAVILTLVHRLTNTIGEISPADESFNSSLWWLQRAATVLNPHDPLISTYIPRVMPNVQQVLNATRQRLSILPGAPPQLLEAARAIGDVQDTLSRRPHPPL